MVPPMRSRKSTATRESVKDIGEEVEASGVRICPAYSALWGRIETAFWLIIFMPPVHTGRSASVSCLGNKAQPGAKVLQSKHTTRLVARLLCRLANNES